MTAPPDAAARRRELAALLAKGSRIGPASFAQRRQWIIDRLVPGSAEYNVAIAVRIDGPVDASLLREAIERTVARQESLRTVFVSKDSTLLQRVLPPGPVPLQVVDVSGRPDPPGAARAWASRLAAEPFDLGKPLLRAALVCVGPDSHLFVAVTHHIVCDGWSAGIFCREVDAQYVALREGRLASLPPLPIQYLDHARLERQVLNDDRLAAEVSYWRERLTGVPGQLRLPLDRPRAAVRRVRAGICPVSLPGSLVERVQDFATGAGTTAFAVYLAAFHALLSRYSGQSTVVTGVPVAGRTRTDVENLIGFFVNTLVLRGDTGDNPSLRTAVARSRETVAGAFAHQEVPFERLVELLHPERDPAVSPFFQTIFNYQAAFSSRISLPGLGGTVEPLDNGTVRFDLEVNLIGLPDGIRGSWNYNRELFDASTVERMVRHYQALLEHALAAPDVGLLDIPLADDSVACAAVSAEGGVYALFAAAAAREPNAVAVRAEGRSWTYRQLMARVRQLARAIHVQGGSVVIALERSPEFVAAVLACRAAGVTAVPLDPDAPPGHQRDVLNDANPTLILTRRRLAEHLPPHEAQVITTDRVPTGPADEPEPADADTAFIRYRPDTRPPVAVPISDTQVANQCAWLTTRVPLGGMLHASPPDDDLAIELLWPLTQGATVVLAPANDPTTIVETVRTENVRTVHWTPRLLEAVLATPGVERCRSLRAIICTGEPLAPHTVRACADVLPGAAIYAGYANAATGLALLSDPPLAERLGLVPMRPTPGATVEIRTEQGLRAPIGVVGELTVNGHRTGDNARLRADGTVEVLGKDLPEVQGVRVEPGEVEPALADHEDVTAAAVVFTGGTATAYVCATNPDVLPALGARARRLLAKQLVPGTIVLLDRMPLLPNGKLDTPALPAVRARARWTQQDHPRTPAEQRIADVFAEVLGRDDVGVQDDFFQIGGHSLLALRLADRLRGLGVDIPVSMLFRYRTVAALADWLGQLGMREAPGNGPMVHRLQTGTEEPSIVLLPGAGGTALSYSGLISALPERTVYAFESGEAADDLPTMAARYRQALPDVPTVLVGWSMGGVVALEMARQIVADGDVPPTVVMIDSFLPDDNARAVADVEQSLVESFVVGVCRELGVPVPRLGQQGLDAALAVLRDRGVVDTGLRRRYGIYRKDMLALRDYRPGRYSGPVHLIRAAESPESTLAATATYDVPGDHWSLLDRDHVQNLATILEEVLCALI